MDPFYYIEVWDDDNKQFAPCRSAYLKGNHFDTLKEANDGMKLLEEKWGYLRDARIVNSHGALIHIKGSTWHTRRNLPVRLPTSHVRPS